MSRTPDKSISVLVVSGGHFFDHAAFFAMFDDMDDISITHAEQPAAAESLKDDKAVDYDVVLFYDMSGIPGFNPADGADAEGLPGEDYRRGIEALLERGTGMVLLNHATVSWPNWPLWRAITGSSYMLQAGELNGRSVPGSGYRGGHGPHPNPTFNLRPETSHPVLEGLEDGFELTDELYLKTPGFEANVLPLLRADYTFEAEFFTPPPLAPPEQQESWQHPTGSNLLVWANSVAASPIVVSEPGDGPAAFGNVCFRRLLANALSWTASAEARAWADSRRRH